MTEFIGERVPASNFCPHCGGPVARVAELEAALRDIANSDPSPTQLQQWVLWVHERIARTL